MAQHTPGASVSERGANSLRNGWRALRGARTERGGEPWAALFFVGPPLLLYIIFNAYPIARGIVLAFTDERYLVPGYAPFVGFGNWVELAHDHVFWESLSRSLGYFAIFLVLDFIIAFIVALLITEIRSGRETSGYRAIVYLPVVLPIAVAVLVWKQILNGQFGYVDVFLKGTLHLHNTPDFIRDPHWTIPVLALIAVWKAAGSNIMLFLVGLYSINTELYEAASLDGAGWWTRLFRITLPLMRPSFTLIFVLGAGVLGVVEETLVFFQIPDAGPENAGRTLGRYAYETAFLQGDLRWGYAAAMNLTVALISIGISALIFRVLRSERVV